MKTTITCTSTWVHKSTGKYCRIHGTKEDDSKATTFRITGHNPLPCFSFRGTYGVLVEWLKANGWERVFNADVYVPDKICVYHK